MKPAHALTVIFAFSLFALISLSSCGDFQHEIVIHPDGSGTIEASFDLGEMMSMMKGFDDAGVPDDTISDDDIHEDTSTMLEPEKAKDPMQQIMDKVTDPNYAQEFDTLLSFAQIMPDSVITKETRMDLVNRFSMHMKSPANSSDLTIGLMIKYDNLKQLHEITNYLDTFSSQEKVMPGMMGGGINKSTFYLYDADLKEGWIRFDSMDYSSFNTEMGMTSDSTSGSEDLGMMQMMFGNSKIRTIVHVPGEVKSCTNKDAVITKDDQVIIEYDFLDVLKKGKVEGFTIKFKPRK
jgi:hypothetical protein